MQSYDQRSPKDLLELGRAMIASGRMGEAISVCEYVLDTNMELAANKSFLYFLATVLLRSGDPALTARCLSKVSQSAFEALPSDILAIFTELQRKQASAESSKDLSCVYSDKVYSVSEEYLKKTDDSQYLPVWKRVLALLKSINATSIVDIGCGPGQFAEFIKENLPYVHYTGVDFSSTAISQAKKRVDDKRFVFYERNVDELDSLDSFNADVFIFLEVLEHIDADRALISKLPPKSDAIFSVPDFDSFSHVRFFNSISQARERYSPMLSIKEDFEVKLSSSATIYLLYGTVKDFT
jgi:SAM-dependent methyltransferase